MRVNGSLRFDGSALSQIENLRVEKIGNGATVPPTFTSADVGRLVYVVDTEILYVGGATAWVPLATGGNAAALQGEVDAIETSLGALFNSNGTWNFGGGTFSNVSSASSLTDLLEQLDAAISGKDSLAELEDVDLSGQADGDVLVRESGEWVARAPGSASGVQEYSAILDGVDALGSGTGVVVKTGASAFGVRNVVSGGDGITVTGGDGLGGDITIAAANDLAAVEDLSSVGFAVRTGSETWTTRSLSGTTGRVVITNADGSTAAPTIDLATVTVAAGGSFQKVTVDGYGRVTEAEPVVAADIEALVDGTYVNAAGDTMSGSLAMGGNSITGLATPANAADAATKAYVDNAVVGLTWEAPVDAIVADATARDALTGLAVGDRVVTEDNNTIYTVTATGTPATFDAGEALVDGSAFFDRSNETGYVFNGTTLTQFTGGGQLTAGIGLVKTGNVLDVNLGAGIAQLPSDEVGIDLANTSTGALILTTDGTTRSTASGSQLHLLTDGSSGLAQAARGLYIAPRGVTNAMLATDGEVTIDVGGGGSGTFALGGTLSVVGDSTQGTTTDVSGSTITVSAVDASVSQKGVASFDPDHFSVTNGAVSLDASLGSLNNVASAVDAAADGDLLVKTSTGWEALSQATLFDDHVLDDLGDVSVSSPAAGQTLVYDGNSFVNRNVYFLYESSAPAASHTVQHNLDTKFCNVTVVDSTDNVVIPESIVFDDADELTVTFNTAIDCKVIVMGIPV